MEGGKEAFEKEKWYIQHAFALDKGRYSESSMFL